MRLKVRVKEQDLHLQRVAQNLYQNDGYARFFLEISRFKYDIDANYAGFCIKILDLIVSTSRKRTFDTEKWFFCINITSVDKLQSKRTGLLIWR